MIKPVMAQWKDENKYPRYTNKATGMIYIKVGSNYWFKSEYTKFGMFTGSKRLVKFVKSGALGGFTKIV